MIKYMIFDMDGVLINTEILHFEAWKLAYATVGVDLCFDCYKGCIGSTAERLLELVEAYYHVSLHDIFEDIRKQFNHYKFDVILKERGIPRIEGAEEAIKFLHEKGIKLAVASSSPREAIEYELGEIGILQYFDVICSAESATRPKPAPDIFEKAAVMLGANKEETAVVEDSRNGCLAANAAGIRCFGFCNPDTANQDLSVATWRVNNFAELVDHCNYFS